MEEECFKEGDDATRGDVSDVRDSPCRGGSARQLLQPASHESVGLSLCGGDTFAHLGSMPACRHGGTAHTQALHLLGDVGADFLHSMHQGFTLALESIDFILERCAWVTDVWREIEANMRGFRV